MTADFVENFLGQSLLVKVAHDRSHKTGSRGESRECFGQTHWPQKPYLFGSLCPRLPDLSKLKLVFNLLSKQLGERLAARLQFLLNEPLGNSSVHDGVCFCCVE